MTVFVPKMIVTPLIKFRFQVVSENVNSQNFGISSGSDHIPPNLVLILGSENVHSQNFGLCTENDYLPSNQIQILGEERVHTVLWIACYKRSLAHWRYCCRMEY